MKIGDIKATEIYGELEVVVDEWVDDFADFNDGRKIAADWALDGAGILCHFRIHGF